MPLKMIMGVVGEEIIITITIIIAIIIIRNNFHKNSMKYVLEIYLILLMNIKLKVTLIYNRLFEK